MTKPPEHKLRWYQYSLRSLFILTTLVAIAFSWYTNEMFKATERRKAIEEIEKLGGSVGYYNASHPNTLGEPPRWFSWLRKLHGDKHLGNAVWVVCVGLFRNAPITDAGLEHLKGLTNLERLNLNGTQVTDAGLVHLKGLPKLKELWLWNHRFTDAGLVHLKGLTKLEKLVLNDTQITDAGLEHLKSLPKLKELSLQKTQITNAGLEHLKGLTNLKDLCLLDTQVTDKGGKNLQQALPSCTITVLTELQQMIQSAAGTPQWPRTMGKYYNRRHESRAKKTGI